MSETFKPGDRVYHARSGAGTVLAATESGAISVQFDVEDGSSQALIRRPGLLRHLKDVQQQRPEPEPVVVFQPEAADIHHDMISHWDPFFDDPQTLLMPRLREIVNQGQLHQAYADVFPPDRPLPPDWPQAHYLAWPDVHSGLMATIRLGSEAHELCSVYPFHERGCQHTVDIDTVHVWASGVEAQIEGGLGDADICFFDTLYARNRGWYQSGRPCEFILTGIAYFCEPAAAETFDVEQPPDVVEWLRQRAREEGEDPARVESVMTVNTEGMAVLLPIPEWDRDDYRFRGPVKSVTEIAMFHQPGWRLRVTVMREVSDQEIDLDIVVTRRVWQGDTPPKAGQDVEGTLWLQGYLWGLDDLTE